MKNYGSIHNTDILQNQPIIIVLTQTQDTGKES